MLLTSIPSFMFLYNHLIWQTTWNFSSFFNILQLPHIYIYLIWLIKQFKYLVIYCLNLTILKISIPSIFDWSNLTASFLIPIHFHLFSLKKKKILFFFFCKLKALIYIASILKIQSLLYYIYIYTLLYYFSIFYIYILDIQKQVINFYFFLNVNFEIFFFHFQLISFDFFLFCFVLVITIIIIHIYLE